MMCNAAYEHHLDVFIQQSVTGITNASRLFHKIPEDAEYRVHFWLRDAIPNGTGYPVSIK